MMIYHLDLDELIANLAFNLQYIFQSVHEYSHRGVDYHRFSFGAVWIVITRSFIFDGSEMGFKPIPLGLVGSFDLVFEIHLIGIYCCCSICSPPFFLFKIINIFILYLFIRQYIVRLYFSYLFSDSIIIIVFVNMTLRCPYDPNHIMPAESFTLHLRKCKATNKHLFAQCKYNLRHVVKKDQLQKHYKYKCKDSPQYRDDSDDDVQEEDSSEWSCGEEEKPEKQNQKNKKKEQRSQQMNYDKSWLKGEKQEVVPEDLKKKVGDISMIGEKNIQDW